MIKAINLENSSNDVVRVLSIADETIINNNPTGLEYILIEDFTEPPTLINSLSINYPMYDKINKKFKWVQIQYQNTATEETLNIENLKITNAKLNAEIIDLQTTINIVFGGVTV